MTRRILLIGAACAMAAGCESSGLSPREAVGNNYAGYVYSLYDTPAPTTAPARLEFPASVAVAQVGEVAPPLRVLQTLRKSPEFFARVEGIPGNNNIPGYQHYASQTPPKTTSDESRRHMERMLNFAREMGVDYLLVYGGTIDQQSQRTPLSALNWTLIGLYIVPSEKIDTHASTAAALIDLRTNRVVMTANANTEKTHMSPTVSANGDRVMHQAATRDQVVDQLAEQVVEQCRSRRGI